MKYEDMNDFAHFFPRNFAALVCAILIAPVWLVYILLKVLRTTFTCFDGSTTVSYFWEWDWEW